MRTTDGLWNNAPTLDHTRPNKIDKGEENNIRARNPKELLSGVMFLIFGVTAAVVSRNYPVGSALRMGPGYFPLVLSGLLIAIGLLCCARSLLIRGEVLEPMGLRPFLLILGATAAFALTIETGGIVVATVLAIGIAALASRESRKREVAVLMVLMLALSVGVFTYALGLPFKVIPG
ncbi:MAG: tripartite tricarboxylate transporter TctB family protein [Burkholderiales bacterium]